MNAECLFAVSGGDIALQGRQFQGKTWAQMLICCLNEDLFFQPIWSVCD